MGLTARQNCQLLGKRSAVFAGLLLAAVFANTIFAPASYSQQNKPDLSKIAPGGYVSLSSGIASMADQKFKLPTDTFRYPIAGLTVFPYYEASPQLKAFLNTATYGGSPLSQFPISPGLPAFSLLPPTDLIRMNVPIPSRPVEKRAAIKMAIIDKRMKDEVPWMVAHDGGQAFGLPGDNDAIAIITPGSMFSACMPRTMVLRCGVMWIMTGARPAAVLTKNAVVSIRPYSIAAVEQTWFNRLRVAELYGQPLEIQLSYQGKAGKVSVDKGQERTISETSLASSAVADQVDPAKSPLNDAAALQSTSPLPGLGMVSSSIDPAAAFISGLKGLTPPFSNAKMDADFQKMFTNYGVSLAARREEISKQVLQRHNLAARPAINKLGRNAEIAGSGGAAPAVSGSETGPVRFPHVTEDLKSMRLRQGMAKYLSSAVLEIGQNGHPLLKSGEAIFAADQSMIVEAGDYSVYLRPRTTAHIVAKNGVVAVKTVKEEEPDSCKIRIKSHIFDCGVGGELIVGSNAPEVFTEMKNDGVGRRHLKSIETAGGSIIVNKSEVDLTSLMQFSPIMRKLYKSRDESDKALVRAVMQTIVALNMVTQGHGGYQRMAGLSGAQ